MVDIVRKLDKMRVDRGWTIYKLSTESEISQQTLHQWFDGDTIPSIPALKKVCNAFGITMSELFSENDMIELSSDLKELYYNWTCLSKEEKLSVEQIVSNYVKNKRK